MTTTAAATKETADDAASYNAASQEAASRARSTPGQLRLQLVALMAVSMIWGVIAVWTASQHVSAASQVVTASEPVSLDAQQIYRSLSDADATAAAAFLSGSVEPVSLSNRYQADIGQAAAQLEAATAAAGQSAAGPKLAVISAQLPVYTGLVDTARADNRLGLPLGAAYLRQASALMRSALLPAASDIYTLENARLAAGTGQATGLPYLAIAAALIAGFVLLRAQRWLARRTHRRLNLGLVVASAAGVASLCWLLAALLVAHNDFHAASGQGSAPAEALARADIAALQAHADESLTLIDDSGDDTFEQDFRVVARQLAPGHGTLLTIAVTAAHGSPGAGAATTALASAKAWLSAHRQLRSLDDNGDHAAAVQSAIGSVPVDAGATFGQLDRQLSAAIGADQTVFQARATAGRDAFGGLTAGMVVLSLVMVAGCARGINRRLAEYR